MDTGPPIFFVSQRLVPQENNRMVVSSRGLPLTIKLASQTWTWERRRPRPRWRRSLHRSTQPRRRARQRPCTSTTPSRAHSPASSPAAACSKPPPAPPPRLPARHGPSFLSPGCRLSASVKSALCCMRHSGIPAWVQPLGPILGLILCSCALKVALVLNRPSKS